MSVGTSDRSRWDRSRYRGASASDVGGASSPYRESANSVPVTSLRRGLIEAAWPSIRLALHVLRIGACVVASGASLDAAKESTFTHTFTAMAVAFVFSAAMCLVDTVATYGKEAGA